MFEIKKENKQKDYQIQIKDKEINDLIESNHETEENEEARKRKVAMCPEQWDSNFGDEFYAYSLNSLYFAPRTQEWNSDSKSHVVDGQLSYSIMSDADIESGFEELKAKGVISDD